jgi:methionine-rich copper-binding protein CopC
MSAVAHRASASAGGVLAVLVVLAVATAGGAHTFLDRSEPRNGAVLKTPPASVRLWFSGAVEPAYSRVHVSDEGGTRVDTGDAEVDGSRKMLRVPLPPLAAGRYRIAWRVLSIDGHLTEGTLRFSVAP